MPSKSNRKRRRRQLQGAKTGPSRVNHVKSGDVDYVVVRDNKGRVRSVGMFMKGEVV